MKKSFKEGRRGYCLVFFSDGKFIGKKKRYFQISFHEMSVDQDENNFQECNRKIHGSDF